MNQNARQHVQLDETKHENSLSRRAQAYSVKFRYEVLLYRARIDEAVVIAPVVMLGQLYICRQV